MYGLFGCPASSGRCRDCMVVVLVSFHLFVAAFILLKIPAISFHFLFFYSLLFILSKIALPDPYKGVLGEIILK
jgi:hypothetical protein